jgi:hypothetical protein
MAKSKTFDAKRVTDKSVFPSALILTTAPALEDAAPLSNTAVLFPSGVAYVGNQNNGSVRLYPRTIKFVSTTPTVKKGAGVDINLEMCLIVKYTCE